MKKFTINRLNLVSNRSIGFLCLALFSIAATGSAQNLLTKTGALTSDPFQAIDQYGAIGSGKAISRYGMLMDSPLPFTYIRSNETNKIWMDRNLGATQVATSSDDIASYGDLYQWGRGTDGHEKRTSTVNTTLATSSTPNESKFITNGDINWMTTVDNTLWQGVSGNNNPCPSGFRVPTLVEFEAERITKAEDAFNRFKMPASGSRWYSTDATINSFEGQGNYWTSTIVDNYYIYSVFFTTTTNLTSVDRKRRRSEGLAVRCIQD